MFKRRPPRNKADSLARAVWPRGGWIRALRYMAFRIRRLPDSAHKIARGIACGIFACFTPFFGLHIFVAMALAWAVGGNILAALLATMFGNPITLPIIAGISIEFGNRILGNPDALALSEVFEAFSLVWGELWTNAGALIGPDPMVWSDTNAFLELVFLPYLVGGLIPGLIAATLAYLLSQPLIKAYQAARRKRLAARRARRRARRQPKEGES
ncbi:DUF2062 domain-containing protein [Palleronia caenipelagi]|uniref:DUF2062 domain-containing protein n=1 Tax=Palleronia caenipelagi TaxID=2489174 RepID=A0A547Q9N5_9RHOB|nr:DUF2062 domain-containing protein [Palleronia caenipelagi]TRD23107.1 DUF2062 domain-containing protein [Palleronia caenipelagi]